MLQVGLNALIIYVLMSLFAKDNDHRKLSDLFILCLVPAIIVWMGRFAVVAMELGKVGELGLYALSNIILFFLLKFLAELGWKKSFGFIVAIIVSQETLMYLIQYGLLKYQEYRYFG